MVPEERSECGGVVVPEGAERVRWCGGAGRGGASAVVWWCQRSGASAVVWWSRRGRSGCGGVVMLVVRIRVRVGVKTRQDKLRQVKTGPGVKVRIDRGNNGQGRSG